MKAYCLVNCASDIRLRCVNIIQHVIKGISALSADCRPPVLRKIGSVNPKGDFTHPAAKRVLSHTHGKAVFLKTRALSHKKGAEFSALFLFLGKRDYRLSPLVFFGEMCYTFIMLL